MVTSPLAGYQQPQAWSDIKQKACCAPQNGTLKGWLADARRGVSRQCR